jgi:hypothetical protein
MSRSTIVRILLPLAVICVAGCGANWRPITLPQTEMLKEGTIVEFHTRDSVVRIHAVRTTHDSISGISWVEHTSCDSCRKSYAIADVSQLRTGNPGNGGWVIMGPLIGVLLFGAVLASAWPKD